MKTTIKKIEELNQMAQMIKTLQDEKEVLWKAKNVAAANFELATEKKLFSEYTEEDKVLFEAYNKAYNEYFSKLYEVSKIERKFSTGVKTLAKSLGLEVVVPSRYRLTYIQYNEILNTIRVRVWRLAQEWDRMCRDTTYPRLKPVERLDYKLSNNYKEVIF